MSAAKRVLIAGASGYLGRYAVSEFSKRGYRIRALVRNPEKIKTAGPHGEPAIYDLVDEIVIGDVTDPATIEGVCNGVDIVFSALGLTAPDPKLTSYDVDHLGNGRILEQAIGQKVSRFIYVSVFNQDKMPEIPTIKAHERFVADLKASGLSWAVIRPNGYFSDMGRFFSMARSGHLFMVGEGEKKINPIHGADLAVVCADAADGECREIPVGGPDIYTFRAVMEMAFHACGKSPWITSMPMWLAEGSLMVTGLFNRNLADLLSFAVEALKFDHVAPAYGSHHLKDFFAGLASAGKHD
ncbi:SDR family oxidoreductase [Chlorobium ferrooxidans]|uniref:NAD-dependent epimerase/dehydratase:3-beta hydroxysteroid dehydrogenase/isomerase:NmrA-like n=1 Tax=Chlorobium ferrooxidans DSM 13031 TaxID=377431 RepID=Q0YQH5_9CHLB|nr:SDR family oxidoreductase [Chlorobium ferrooxidans]EAT58535.1 NAD-dependent epimerase/dehydratase:3-beta hydroxysteroid dehydrogenase/isomerase:NmrA-like [Chlorobium ferrooxidans DSM 13031]